MTRGPGAPRKYTREDLEAAALRVVRDEVNIITVAEESGIARTSIAKAIQEWRRNNPRAAIEYANGNTSQPPEYWREVDRSERPSDDDLRARMAASIRKLLDLVELETDRAVVLQTTGKLDPARLEKLTKIQKGCADLVRAWADMTPNGKPKTEPKSALAKLADDLPGDDQ